MTDDIYNRIINEYLDRYLDNKISLPHLAKKLKEDNEVELAERTIRYKLAEAIERITGKTPSELKYSKTKPITTVNKNVLVIGDLHLPFVHKDYLEFCKAQYLKYECNKVVFIGDVLDSHFSSFHDVSTTAYSADEELDLAKSLVKDWYDAFPNAIVIIGNHDAIHLRKAERYGVSKKWIKGFSEVLDTPGWIWVNDYVHNDIYYVHGIGSTARTTSARRGISTVQGHRHSELYLHYHRPTVWGMQIGTGIDESKYAFEYAKHGTLPTFISCAVIKDKTPILCIMDN